MLQILPLIKYDRHPSVLKVAVRYISVESLFQPEAHYIKIQYYCLFPFAVPPNGPY